MIGLMGHLFLFYKCGNGGGGGGSITISGTVAEFNNGTASPVEGYVYYYSGSNKTVAPLQANGLGAFSSSSLWDGSSVLNLECYTQYEGNWEVNKIIYNTLGASPYTDFEGELDTIVANPSPSGSSNIPVTVLVQNSGRQGYNGATVQIVNQSTGAVIVSATTNENGVCSFTTGVTPNQQYNLNTIVNGHTYPYPGLLNTIPVLPALPAVTSPWVTSAKVYIRQ
jgi:hypothetical protein